MNKERVREMIRCQKKPQDFVKELKLKDQKSFEEFHEILEEIEKEDQGLKDSSQLIREKSPDLILKYNANQLNQQIQQFEKISQSVNQNKDYKLDDIYNWHILEDAYNDLVIIEEGAIEIEKYKSNRTNVDADKIRKMYQIIKQKNLSQELLEEIPPILDQLNMMEQQDQTQ